MTGQAGVEGFPGQRLGRFQYPAALLGLCTQISPASPSGTWHPVAGDNEASRAPGITRPQDTP